MNAGDYVKTLSFSINDIEEYIKRIKNLNVLVIGDTIIDRYVFVRPKGRAVKDPILSVEYLSHENYAGGILAIANHVNDFAKRVKLVTVIGDLNDKIKFIKKSLGKNIDLKTFVNKNTHTIVKKRFVDIARNAKLFKIEYMEDSPLKPDLTKEIVNYLDEELPKYDLVILGDFGHGFINKEIRRKLEEKSKFLAINVQSNSANMGYNYLTLYNRADFAVMNEQELRLPLLRRFENVEEVVNEACEKFNLKSFIVTEGKEGCIFMNDCKLVRAPALTKSVKDAVGAGDALFAIAALFLSVGANGKMVPFVANCAGGIGANIMGNKESVTREKLVEFAREALNS